MKSDAFGSDLAATLSAFGASLALATVLGTAVGAAMGASRTAYHLLNPHMTALNAVPKIALMPIVVMWFGLGFPSAVFLGTLMGSFPIAVSVYAGMRGLERDYVLLARAFGATRMKTALSVVVPGLVPHLIAALRIAVNYVLVGVLIVEFFASDRGLGYRMVVFSQNFQVASFFSILVLVMGLALGLAGALYWLESRLTTWRPEALE
jgi:NitT/TauT family transport system permease protein